MCVCVFVCMCVFKCLLLRCVCDILNAEHLAFFLYTDLLLKKHVWLLSMLKTVVPHNIVVETEMLYDSNILRRDRKIKTLISKEKWHERHLQCYKTCVFQINTVILNVLFIKGSWKKCFMISIQQKLFSNQNIRTISEGSVKTAVMMLKTQLWSQK